MAASYGPFESHELWTVVLAGVFFIVLSGLFFSLWAIVQIAKRAMLPRPKYVEVDRTFTDYERGQNWSWDWCFVFPVRPDSERAKFHKDARIEGYTLRYVVERLAIGGLETALSRSYDRSAVFVKIRASAGRLKAEAARTEYNLMLDPREVVKRIERGHRDASGAYAWYPRRAGWHLPDAPAKAFDNAIVDTRRQSALHFSAYVFGRYDARPDAQSAYARYLPSNSIFRGVDRLKLIKSIMEADAKSHGAQLNVNELLATGVLLAAFPLHADGELAVVMDSWLTWRTWPWAQPVDLVKDYFGEKIGMYFHFLGHYTTWLGAPAALGVATWLARTSTAGAHLDYVTPVFAVAMSLWVTAFLESWKVAEATAAMRWGMTGFSEVEQARPQFSGITINSPVTGMPELYFPYVSKVRLQATSYAFVFLATCALVAAFASVYVVEAFVSNRPVASRLGEGVVYAALGVDPGGVLTDIAVALVIFASCGAFVPLARRLNEYENHRTDTQFENHLIAKVFFFFFIASYGPLFYTATLKGSLAEWCDGLRMGRLKPRMVGCAGNECFAQIATLLSSQFLVRVVGTAFFDVGLPFLRLARRRRETVEDNTAGEYHDPTDPRRRRKRQVSPTEEQFRNNEYHNLLGTFEDYAEIVVQFGYSTLFVVAFPLAPLFAAVSNFIELRTDAFKLCNNVRRPWPTGAANIGTWSAVLDFMSHVAVATNALLITYTGPTLSNHTVVARLLVFAAYEYVLISVKLMYVLVRDDLPPEVGLQLDRADFLTRKIVSNEPDDPKEDPNVGEADADLDGIVVLNRDPEQRGTTTDAAAEAMSTV